MYLCHSFPAPINKTKEDVKYKIDKITQQYIVIQWYVCVVPQQEFLPVFVFVVDSEAETSENWTCLLVGDGEYTGVSISMSKKTSVAIKSVNDMSPK